MSIASSSSGRDIPQSIDRFASWILPKNAFSQILLWLLLPLLLFIATLSLSSFCLSPITPYLFLLSISAIVLSIRFRTFGLAIIYGVLLAVLLFFYKDIAPHERLWQMQLLFSIAIETYILLLAVEEVEGLLHTRDIQSEKDSEKIKVFCKEQEGKEQNWEEERARLEEELRRLKEEAEQRKIEKASDEKRICLIESEITMLTAQKEELINEAFAARAASAEFSYRLQEEIKKRERCAEALPQVVTDEQLKRDKARAEGLYNQLRIQFEEKSKILSQARKALFQAEGKLTAHEYDNLLREMDPDLSEINGLQTYLNRCVEEKLLMEEEIVSLEALISHFLSR